jgi:putative ABC transport system permease protein
MIVETAKTGARNLLANPLRSLLSILGIVFGVATLVATLSIGEGTKRQILATIEALGTNLVLVSEHRMGGPAEERTPGLLMSDVEYLERQMQGMADEATAEQSAGRRISYRTSTQPHMHFVIGTTANYASIRKLDIARGRFLHEKDIRDGARVCVVGAKVSERLGVGDLLGDRITIDSIEFEVVGVLDTYGGSATQGGGPDWIIWVPITVSQAMSEEPLRVNRILLASRSAALAEATKDEVGRLLKMRHGVEDFVIETQEELLQKRREFTTVFQITLGGIAVVSLIVGGIGIMNILLAAVNERVREIGVRKALGATPADILLQFLAESLMLTLVGGALGVGFGRFMALRVAPLLNERMPQRAYEWQAVTPAPIVLLALGFALVVGLVFGLYPAYKASKLDPCEALAYE